MAAPVSNSAIKDKQSDAVSAPALNPSNFLHPDSVLTAGRKSPDKMHSADGKPGSSSSSPPPSPTSSTEQTGGDDDDEEITETKIIGVTETGVIRKRSFKRKLTKEERDKRGYGTDRAEYDKISESVMSERFMSSALDGLRDRGKMLAFMHGDCLALLDKWEKRRQDKMQRRHNQDRDFIISVVTVAIACLVFCWLVWVYIV